MLSGDKVGVSQRPHDLEHHNRMNAKAVRKIQLFSVEPDIKEICKKKKKKKKKGKEMPFFPLTFLDLENSHFSQSVIYVNMLRFY